MTLLTKAGMAGGDHFEVAIQKFSEKTKGEYRMELLQHTTPYGFSEENLPQKIVVHLRFNPKSIIMKLFNVSKSKLKTTS